MGTKFNYILSVTTLVLIFILINLSGVTECIYIDQETPGNNSFTGWTPEIWNQSNQSEFSSGILLYADTVSLPGSVRIQCSPDSYVFALRGDNSEDFWVYNSFSMVWTAVNNSRRPVGAGGALAYDESGDMYAFMGNNTDEFWKYNLSRDSWYNLASSPYNASFEGGSLAYDGASLIYALTNDYLSGGRFLSYEISGGIWNTLEAPSCNVSFGTLLACDGDNSVYAFPAGSETHFLKYNISAKKWNSLNATPSPAYHGAAIVYDGDRNSIYALRGNSTNFLKYDLGNDTWHNLGDTPGIVEAGASLAYDGNHNIYAFQGGSKTAFWRYNLSSDAWVGLADTPGPVSYGGSLTFVSDPEGKGGHFSGIVSSKVLDTENNGTMFNGLFRDETLEADTGINFEIRANDTIFLKNASTPAWTAVVGSSSVTPVSGRYMQWRASLTTTNFSKSPLLQEVRVYYTI